ncbi:uncharacterized protein LOC106181377 [Lingula anatina]|uniref:Uncharacterized protein LOC106181377 n=1 Tax=Lingula anatina TaxID=7574 RepID=A0A1S3KFG5_LINAN|nr:uncharacterized protein LOC106181377 [Lingula anatina]|eukprot:XP_013421199.1 uncharacterized protein LOC106181377 [Lingula anatina]
MADGKPTGAPAKDEKLSSNGEGMNSDLSDFMKEQYQQQKASGRIAATDAIDEERAAAFYKRAISESSRMNQEIAKSHKKLDDLHVEYGSEIFEQWRQEHAAQVLTSHHAELVEASQPVTQ